MLLLTLSLVRLLETLDELRSDGEPFVEDLNEIIDEVGDSAAPGVGGEAGQGLPQLQTKELNRKTHALRVDVGRQVGHGWHPLGHVVQVTVVGLRERSQDLVLVDNAFEVVEAAVHLVLFQVVKSAEKQQTMG